MDGVLDWIPVIVSVLAFVLGLLNLWYRGPSMNMVEKGQYLKSANEAISLANNRALLAEQRVVELEGKLAILESKLDKIEKSMFYKISFYAMLGTEPKIEHVEITHFGDRRSKDRSEESPKT